MVKKARMVEGFFFNILSICSHNYKKLINKTQNPTKRGMSNTYKNLIKRTRLYRVLIVHTKRGPAIELIGHSGVTGPPQNYLSNTYKVKIKKNNNFKIGFIPKLTRLIVIIIDK